MKITSTKISNVNYVQIYLTEEELKNLAPSLGEYFTKDVENINNGYPILKWQIEEDEQ